MIEEKEQEGVSLFNIVIIEDDPIFRKELAMFLSSMPGIEVAGTYAGDINTSKVKPLLSRDIFDDTIAGESSEIRNKSADRLLC